MLGAAMVSPLHLKQQERRVEENSSGKNFELSLLCTYSLLEDGNAILNNGERLGLCAVVRWCGGAVTMFSPLHSTTVIFIPGFHSTYGGM